jgi:hypothetical protein
VHGEFQNAGEISDSPRTGFCRTFTRDRTSTRVSVHGLMNLFCTPQVCVIRAVGRADDDWDD